MYRYRYVYLYTRNMTYLCMCMLVPIRVLVCNMTKESIRQNVRVHAYLERVLPNANFYRQFFLFAPPRRGSPSILLRID